MVPFLRAGGPPYHFCSRVPHSTGREAEVGWGFSVESSEIGVEVNYPTLARPTITPCSSARARMGHPQINVPGSHSFQPME